MNWLSMIQVWLYAQTHWCSLIWMVFRLAFSSRFRNAPHCGNKPDTLAETITMYIGVIWYQPVIGKLQWHWWIVEQMNALISFIFYISSKLLSQTSSSASRRLKIQKMIVDCDSLDMNRPHSFPPLRPTGSLTASNKEQSPFGRSIFGCSYLSHRQIHSILESIPNGQCFLLVTSSF